MAAQEGKVAFIVDSANGQLIKSAKRVRDLGEVFTPSSTVQEMLDLLPCSIWRHHPAATFLEPACGNGNFLVAILDRKLDRIAKDFARGTLIAGAQDDAAQFHALEALSSIYAVDISSDNIVGGTPGHGVGARTRMLNLFADWNTEVLGKRISGRNLVLSAASWIVDHNLIVGNMLAFDAMGRPTGRDQMPLIEYNWDPVRQLVSLGKTTLGDVIATEESKTATKLSLFAPAEPVQFWRGKATSLAEAERVESPKLRGPVRNGTGRRER